MVLLDPTLSEEIEAMSTMLATFTAGSGPENSLLISSSCTGVFTENNFISAHRLLQATVPLIYGLFSKSVVRITKDEEECSS